MFASFNLSFYDKKHQFANIELDALLSQSVKLTNIISEHPLETGEILNDAIHNQPLEISFSAVISDLPQSTVEQVTTISDSVSAILGTKPLASSKSLRAWKELFLLWKSKTLVTITSPLQNEVFEDMAIKDMTITPEDTESLNFTVNLKQVLISENIKKFNLAPEIGKQSIRP
jgi:hypothetical protein